MLVVEPHADDCLCVFDAAHALRGLLALYAAEESPKYGKAATRWLGRLALEPDDLALVDLHLAASALQALPRRPDSALRVPTDLSRHPAPAGKPGTL